MSDIAMIIGSTLGGAEYVGDHLIELFEQNDQRLRLIEPSNIEVLSSIKTLIFITSTHGAGDYPDNIAAFMAELEQKQPSLNHLNYALIALGDSSYDTYCLAGRKADDLFRNLKANSLCPRLEIDALNDQLPELTAETWFTQHKNLLLNKS